MQDDLIETEFEQRFFSSVASTAVAAETNTALKGSLHEVEYIVPELGINHPVYLVGYLFVEPDEKIVIKNKDIMIDGISLFSEILASIQIGGEKRCGFGRLSLCQEQCEQVQDESIFGYRLYHDGQQWMVTVPAKCPILAHGIINRVLFEGMIEPLVGREWSLETGPGRAPVRLIGLCYTPGSIVDTEMLFTISNYRIWELKETKPDNKENFAVLMCELNGLK